MIGNILIIEENREWRDLLSRTLSDQYTLRYWPDGNELVDTLQKDHSEIIILDLGLRLVEPFSLLETIKSCAPETTVIVTSEIEETTMVVKAVRHGAHEFIAKPYSAEQIKMALDQTLNNRSLKNELDYLRHEQDVIYSFDRVIAHSQAMKAVLATLKKFSETDATILITGETGTGKSFLSGTIHYNSRRRRKPFIQINCTNIPETLLESELFGHEKGAFTGANRTRVGRFEQANGGSAFLDEIGEMTLDLQAKLLRVLDEKSFERVGGNRTIRSDVRIICATNRILEEQVAAGRFREDFYYRINVLTVRLPPLRERKQCIEPLAGFLLQKSCRTLRKPLKSFSKEVMGMFLSYSWPGNIRQLANTIERAVILQDGEVVGVENIFLPEPINRQRPTHSTTYSPSYSQPHPNNHSPAESEEAFHGPQPLHEHEKEIIFRALEDNLWIQKDAAQQLGISPRALNYKIRKLGITHPRWRKNK